jgi:hypothetical protein
VVAFAHALARPPLFTPGRLLATPGALALGVDLRAYLARHVRGDWGDLDGHDRAANDYAVGAGDLRVLSAYTTPAGRLWIITEADRSVTTCLLREEY